MAEINEARAVDIVSKFMGKKEAWGYCKDKHQENPNYFKKINAESDVTLETSFLSWRNTKKCMFSPAEYAALASDGDVKNAKVNEFVDWGEELPRRTAVIIVAQNKQAKAIGYAEEVDVIGGSDAFTTRLSESGVNPVEYYMSVWCCSQREYEFFEEINDWNLFDGVVTPWQKVLINEGLKVIAGGI
jgi:hypothetical protein